MLSPKRRLTKKREALFAQVRRLLETIPEDAAEALAESISYLVIGAAEVESRRRTQAGAR